jgi:hypothetical protein
MVIRSRRMRLAGHTARMGIRNVYKILVRKAERKRPLGRPKHKWDDNIKTDFKLWDVDWIHLAQYRVHWLAPVKLVMNLQVQ